jgi:hypothetical protein
MADVLQRYNNATQAYSSGISGANEFQNSYNQNFYNDFLTKNAAYKSAVERQKEAMTALRDQATAAAANASNLDKEEASRLVEAGGAAVGGIEVAKGIYKRVRKGANGGEDGSGGSPDAGGANETSQVSAMGDGEVGDAGSMRAAVNTAMADDDLATPPVSPRQSADMDAEPPTQPAGELDAAHTSASAEGGGEGVEGANFGSLGEQPYARSAVMGGNESRADVSMEPSTDPAVRTPIQTAGEEAGEVAGEVGGVETEALGTSVAAEAATAGAAATGAAIGEGLATALAVAPELAGVALVGYGLYDLFHHHHHHAAPVTPDQTGIKVPDAPKAQPAAQGATSDVRSTRAEFTTPSFDAVTDVAGSISAF